MFETRHRVADSITAGVTDEQASVTRESVASVLGESLSAGDILLDLAWSINAITSSEWCRREATQRLGSSLPKPILNRSGKSLVKRSGGRPAES